MSSLETREKFAKEMWGKFSERNVYLKQVDSRDLPEKQKEEVREKIIKNFESQMAEIKSMPWYQEANYSHIAVIQSKIAYEKAQRQRQKLEEKYQAKMKEVWMELGKRQQDYENAKKNYFWDDNQVVIDIDKPISEADDDSENIDNIFENNEDNLENNEIVIEEYDRYERIKSKKAEIIKKIKELQEKGADEQLIHNYEKQLDRIELFEEDQLKYLYLDLQNIRDKINKSSMGWESEKNYFEWLKSKEAEIVAKIYQLWWDVQERENIEFREQMQYLNDVPTHGTIYKEEISDNFKAQKLDLGKLKDMYNKIISIPKSVLTFNDKECFFAHDKEMDKWWILDSTWKNIVLPVFDSFDFSAGECECFIKKNTINQGHLRKEVQEFSIKSIGNNIMVGNYPLDEFYDRIYYRDSNWINNDKCMNILELQYEKVVPLYGESLMDFDDVHYCFVYDKDTKKWWVSNMLWKIIVDPISDCLVSTWPNDGGYLLNIWWKVFEVEDNGEDIIFIDKQSGCWYWLEEFNNWLSPIQLKNENLDLGGSFVDVLQTELKMKYRDKYDNIVALTSWCAKVCKDGQRWLVLAKKGSGIIYRETEIEYESIEKVKDWYLAVKNGETYKFNWKLASRKVWNLKPKKAVIIWDIKECVYFTWLRMIQKNWQWWLFDKKWKEIISPKYESIEEDKNWFIVKNDWKSWLIKIG